MLNIKIQHTINILYNRTFSRSISQKSVKITGENKHFPPAVKEWPDSVYGYNKNYIKHTVNKKNTINSLIKSYFNLYDKNNSIRYKNVRKLVNHKSLNKLFISKPLIKHNNDKVIINLFAYDKSSKLNIKNLYFNNSNLIFLNKWLEKQLFTRGKDYTNIHTQYLVNKLYNNKINKTFNYINNITGTNLSVLDKDINSSKLPYLYSYFNKMKNRNLIYTYINKNKTKKVYKLYKKYKKLQNITFKKFINTMMIRKQNKLILPFRNIKNESNIIMFRSINMKNDKLKYIQKLFIYYFLISVFHVFNLSIKILHNKDKVVILIYNYNNIINTILIPNSNLTGKLIKSYDYLNKMNFILWNTLIKTLNSSKVKNYNIKLLFLFKFFYSNYHFKLLTKILKNNMLRNVNYFRLMINKYKYGNFLYFLKSVIYNLYNKRVNINIVNLKYPQLNSDIITNIMTRKLKRKKGTYSKVLGKSLILTKLPIKTFNRENIPIINNLKDLDSYKSIKLNVNVYNLVNNFIKKIYPSDIIKKETISIEYDKLKYTNTTGKISNILNNIKYKWITGIRLETAGRLTRRFTAARSIYKFKYKGNLKNLDFYTRNGINKPISTLLLRNYVKANSQYTTDKSKKRIGAFNIKTWISSY